MLNVGPDGAAFPNQLFANAGKFHDAANYNHLMRHLHEIAGGAVLTTPGTGRLRERRGRQ